VDRGGLEGGTEGSREGPLSPWAPGDLGVVWWTMGPLNLQVAADPNPDIGKHVVSTQSTNSIIH